MIPHQGFGCIITLDLGTMPKHDHHWLLSRSFISLLQGDTCSLLILRFSNLVIYWKFLFLRPSWLYISWRPFSCLARLGLHCHLVPCYLFKDYTGSNLLSSTSPQPCLSLPLPLILPLFPLPWPLAGLVIWIMKVFCKSN
jgi:hypothetical protein